MMWTPYECIQTVAAISAERGPHVIYPRFQRRRVCPICEEPVTSGEQAINIVGRKHHMSCFTDFAEYLKANNTKLLLIDYADILEEKGL